MLHQEKLVRDLSSQIERLTANGNHLKDQSVRQDLQSKISERKNYLREIKEQDFNRYRHLALELGAKA